VQRLFAAALAALTVSSALAHELEVGPFQITHPWTHASPAGATAAPIYMTVALSRGSADRLIGAASPVADGAEVHRHIGSGDAEVLPSVTVTEDSPAVLSPEGDCLVLMGLHAPLREFETFPLTLRFEKAGAITVEVTVEEPGAGEPRQDYGL
jgi:periplasmic copper chaperone A